MTRSDSGHAPASPTYAEIGSTVRLLDGEPVKRVRNLMNTIFDQDGAGTPALDWSDPERWIEERRTTLHEIRVVRRVFEEYSSPEW